MLKCDSVVEGTKSGVSWFSQMSTDLGFKGLLLW